MIAVQDRVESGLSHKTFNKVGLLLKLSEERVPVPTPRTRPNSAAILFVCVCVLQTTRSTMAIEKWVSIMLH